MSLLAKCPECGHQFKLPEKYAGLRGKCPQCEHLFRAPTLEEEVVDWGSEAEDLGQVGSTPAPAVTAPSEPASRRPARPKIPLPKRLAEVTPPPAPGGEEDLPDLASLSVPGGPPPTPPPVAAPSEPGESLPDLSALTETAAPSPRSASAGPAEPDTFPDFSVATGEREGKEKKRRPAAGGMGGTSVDGGAKHKRRASDVFDAGQLAAQLGQVETPAAEKPPLIETGKSSTPTARAAQPGRTPRPVVPASEVAADKPGPPAKVQAPKPDSPSAAPPPVKPVRSRTAAPLPRQTAAAASGRARAAEQTSREEDSAAVAEAAKSADVVVERPRTEGESGTSSPADLAVATGQAESATRPAALGRARQQPANKPWVLFIVAGALAAVIVCFVGAWVLTSVIGGDGGEVAVDGEHSRPPGERVDRDAEGGESTVQPAAPTTLAELPAARWDELKHAVVRIEVVREDHRLEVGTGFLIEPRGWVATANSLIYRGTSATVVTYEKSYRVAGTVARDPELDLAILQIDDLGDQPNLPTLTLKDDLQRIEKQTAYVFNEYFNSRLDASQCLAERSLPMNELRPTERPFVPARARVNGLLNWVEITGRVTGPAHGGPLVDAEGQVIGTSMYLGEASKYSYALHVKHLAELRQAAGDKVQPLTPDPLARSDRPDRPNSVSDVPEPVTPEGPSASPPESPPPKTDAGGTDSAGNGDAGADDEDPYAIPDSVGSSLPAPDTNSGIETPPVAEPDLAAEPTEITPAKLAEALQACEALTFVPITKEDYAKFQHLAFLFHEIQRMAEDETQPEERREELGQAATEVANRLALTSWVDVSSVNKLAVEAMGRPHRGMSFYGTVGQTSSKDQNSLGRNLVLLSLEGTDEIVVLPVDKVELSELSAGGRWLVLGMRDPLRTFQLNLDGNQRTARLVEAKFIIAESRPE